MELIRADCVRIAGMAEKNRKNAYISVDIEHTESVYYMITNTAINHAIDYILEHINEEQLSVDMVAAHCNFSKFYFSRLFKAEIGESIYAFIKRLKLEQSAFRLKTQPSRSITEICYDYGYSSSNYSSAFRQQYQMAPMSFRKEIYRNTIQHAFFHKAEHEIESFADCDKKITIKELPDFFVIYERRIGNYHCLSDNWNHFLQKYRDFLTNDTLFLERTFDDPSITNQDGCLYDICISMDKERIFEYTKSYMQSNASYAAPYKLQNHLLDNTCTIQGGKCIVYPFKGHAKYIFAAYQTIFCVWLPQTQYQLDNRCGFDIYHYVDFPTMYMELDICIPIK